MNKKKKLKGRKYLNDLGLQGCCLGQKKYKRQEQWKKERKKYGFDERDTWSLNGTMMDLLYERVKMFDEFNIVNTDFHTIKIDGQEKTQQEWMDIILKNYEIYSDSSTESAESRKLEEETWHIWSKISPYMWW